MGSRRVVGAIIRGGRRSSFLSNYLPCQFATPSLASALAIIFGEFTVFGLILFLHIKVLSSVFGEHTFFYNGLILGIKGFLSFLSGPLIGSLSDSFGRKPFLLITVLGTVCPIPFLLVNPLTYFCLICVSGIFNTFSIVHAYVADFTDEHERTFAYGAVSATFALSLVVSPALGSYISEYYNDDLVIMLATLIAVLDIFFILFFVPESLPKKLRQKSKSFWETADPFGALRKASKDRLILSLCISVFLSYLPEAGQYSCIFVYLKLIIGFSQTEVAFFIAFLGILSMFAQTILLTYFNKKFGSKNSILIGLMLQMLQMICFGLGSSLWVIWAAGLIAATSSITYPAISAYVSNYADADKQGLVQGIITGIRGLCNGLGPLAFGLVFSLFNIDLNIENSQPLAIHPTQLLPLRNNSLSSLYGLLNSSFSHHNYSPEVPGQFPESLHGAPFLFSSFFIVIAILVMAFIPELVQVPPTSAHYGESASGPFASSKNRAAVMSPSRLTPRSSSTTSSNNYYYKSMHMPTSLGEETDCSPSDNDVKMMSTHQIQHHSHASLPHELTGQRKALLAVESSTLYIPSTSCTLSSENESEMEKGDDSSDDDQTIFEQLQSKSHSTATISVSPIQGTTFTPIQMQRAIASALNQSAVEIRPSNNNQTQLSKLHSHQLLPTFSSSSSPTLSVET